MCLIILPKLKTLVLWMSRLMLDISSSGKSAESLFDIQEKVGKFCAQSMIKLYLVGLGIQHGYPKEKIESVQIGCRD